MCSKVAPKTRCHHAFDICFMIGFRCPGFDQRKSTRIVDIIEYSKHLATSDFREVIFLLGSVGLQIPLIFLASI
jgi:hypothetical protein